MRVCATNDVAVFNIYGRISMTLDMQWWVYAFLCILISFCCTWGSLCIVLFFSSRRRHTRFDCDWSSDVCSSDLGSAADDFYGANRVGDDLFANSLLALKAETGERVWHFQFVRHDIWDRDLPAPPNLVTVRRNGRMVDAVAQITKSGHVFLFNRTTGAPLFPLEYRKYPPSDVEGEITADSQPFPLKPEPFARQQLTEGMLTNRTPEAQRAVRERFRMLRSGGQFVPASLQGTIVFPGLDGGAEWGGAAFDPETSILYVNANEMPWTVALC